MIQATVRPRIYPEIERLTLLECRLALNLATINRDSIKPEFRADLEDRVSAITARLKILESSDLQHFDYDLQVWVEGGVILGCGHPDHMRVAGPCCNADRYRGMTVAAAVKYRAEVIS